MIIRTPRELGHLVRDARTRRALTQAQLADEVGVSRKWIIDLEAGKRTTDLSLVLRTLNALQLTLDVNDGARQRAKRAISDIDAIVAAAIKSRR